MSDNPQLKKEIDRLIERDGLEAVFRALGLEGKRQRGRPTGSRKYSDPTLVADVADLIVSEIDQTPAIARVAEERWRSIGSSQPSAAEKGILRAFNKANKVQLLKEASERRGDPTYSDLRLTFRRTNWPELIEAYSQIEAIIRQLGGSLHQLGGALHQLDTAVRERWEEYLKSGVPETLALIFRDLPDK